MDESAVSLQFPVRSCWMRKGEQKCLPAARRPQETSHFLGAYNWNRAHVTLQAAHAKNATSCIAFLQHLLLEQYPHQTVVLVMDNAPFHRSNAVQAFLSLFEHRVIVFWLPAYSPDMNIIERFWKHLKDRILANKLFLDIPALLARVSHFIDAQNCPSHPLRIVFS